MRIEAFTESRNPLRPEANEDGFVVLPGRAYAVVDGVSDRTGVLHDGMLTGRFAAQLVTRALERLLIGSEAPLADPAAIVSYLTAVIADSYRERGVLEQARADWGCRFATTLALAVTEGERVRLVLVGDSGVRLNGGAVRRLQKDLDLITATLRQRAWLLLAERGTEPVLREQLSRRIAMHGTGQPPGVLAPALDIGDLARIDAEAVALCVAALPRVPRVDIERLIRQGIVRGQGGYQNNADAVLGYSCLDGFPVAAGLMHVADLPRAEVGSIELFTDGYFVPGDGFGVAAWEASFRRIEQQDPAKVVSFLAPKGSCDGSWADDRTYLGVRL